MPFPIEDQPVIREYELSRKTRLIVESVTDAQVVSIGYWCLTGSRDEGSDENGYSHFLEHMLFKGTQSRTALQLVKEIDRVGGIINAFTEKELICVYVTIQKEYLSLAVEILSDMVFHSILDKEELEKEKLVVVNEVRSIEDNPDELAHELYLAKLWGEHPLAHRITGEESDIRKITREKLDRFYRHQILPENLLITVAGDIVPDEARVCIEKFLENPPKGEFHSPRRVPPSRHFSWEQKKSRFQQVQLYTGTELPFDRGNLRWLYSSLVFSAVMGESMSSRLFQEIRENLGLCYTIVSFRTLLSDTCHWSIYASTTPRQLGDLMAALESEFHRLVKDSMSGPEIEDAKSHLKGGLILSMSDMETRMKRLARVFLLSGGIMEYAESVGMIESTSLKDVEELVGQSFTGKSSNMLVYGGRTLRNFNSSVFYL